MADVTKNGNISICGECDEKEPSSTVDRNVTWFNLCGKWYADSSNNMTRAPMWSRNSTS